MNIHIRKAERRDAETIASFNAAMAKETEHLDLDSSRVLQGVHGLFDQPSLGYYLLAEIEGNISGQMMVTYEWSDWRNGIFWWIQSVYVRSEYRAHGVFRALYDHVIQEAHRAKNVCGIRLYVEKENERAHHVYEKIGMNRTAYDMFETDFVLKR